jgi:hypothetical protein
MSFIAELSHRCRPKHLFETLFNYSFDYLTFVLSVFFEFNLRSDDVLRADYSHSLWMAVGI